VRDLNRTDRVEKAQRKPTPLHGMRLMMTRLGVLSAHPAVFLVVGIYAALWLVFDWQHFNWGSVATIATLLMTLLIQRAEHRDTQAIHGKLDELLRASGGARTELTRLDEQEPELIERHRARAQAEDQV
jgi:low affinity Fe/Cu permease